VYQKGCNGAVPKVVVAPDKFRGSATARQVAAAMSAGARRAGWTAEEVPVSDGGEGFCDVLGGRPRPVRVRGPLGEALESAWFELDGGRTAAIEMAMASGLDLVGGPGRNDPVRADTAGTGELIAAAVKAGAKRLLVGVGGSASTDGGWGALEALSPHSRLSGVRIEVACDVKTRFLNAAAVFSPQKGATPAQVELLTRRLERLAQIYLERFGVDVTDVEGSGAAGGLAGGLAAIGAVLTPGFDVVAERLDLAGHIEGADLVIAGEGLLDDQSFNGKSVGGVLNLAGELGVPAAVIAGQADGKAPPGLRLHTLVGAYGLERALAEPLPRLEELTAEVLRAS
jgi:glycerate kinase